MKRRLLAVLSIVAICSSCKRDGLSAGRADGLSADLIVWRGATKIRSGAKSGVENLSYTLNMSYPAPDLIASIAMDLASRGWRPTENSWHNRAEASDYVSGWEEFVAVSRAGGKGRYLAQWWAQWRNSQGDVLDYLFAYQSPSEVFTNRTELYVQATRMSASVAASAEANARKMKIYGADKPVVLLPAGTAPNVQSSKGNPYGHTPTS
jgi:hypothetical protein